MEPVKVLVADDNRDAADTLAAVIQAGGGQTRVCYHGLSALIAAEQFRPDVCLLDLAMPGLNGAQVAAQLRAADPDHRVKLVAITGFGSASAREYTGQAGFDLHLVKPVDPDEVLAAVYAPTCQPGPAARTAGR